MFTPRQRAALLLGFVLLVVLRIPLAWVHGRFMDEEGTIFLAYAWHRPAGDALFRSFAGYLNLGATAPTLVVARLARAGILPLERAPYLTMATALAVQALPAVLILTARARWLANRWAVIAALLIVAIAPRTEEVFFNVLHIQFHLALCAALILAVDPPATMPARIGYWAMLLLAPLCGPAAILLLPLFVLRALLDRNGARLAQAIALATGTALQMLIFFGTTPVRGQLLDPVTLASIMFVRLVALPFATPPGAKAIGKLVHAAYQVHGAGWWAAALVMLAYAAGLVAAALRRGRDAAIWLVLSALAIAAVSYSGGMITSNARDWFSIGAGERYDFLPLVLLTWGLVALAMRPETRWRGLYVGLCALTLVSGAIAYPKKVHDLRDGPSWPAEVATWRRDHDHPLAGWPASWSVDLSDRDRPCHLPGSTGPALSDPSYCESAWQARVTKAIAAKPDIKR